MDIWFIDHDGKKVSKVQQKWGGKIVHLTTSGVAGKVIDPHPSGCGISGDSLVILHTQEMGEWVKYIEENANIYALFVSDDTGGRVLSCKDDSLKNAYFSVKYKFDTLIDHHLFKNLISAAKNADNTEDKDFKTAWKALKVDLAPLAPLVIANAMLSAGLVPNELPQELNKEAVWAYESIKEKDDPEWDAFIKQDAEKRNRWLGGKV